MGGGHPDIRDDGTALEARVDDDDPGEEGTTVEVVVRSALRGDAYDADQVREGETGEHEGHGEGGNAESGPLLAEEEDGDLGLLAAEDEAVGDQALWRVVVEPTVLEHGNDGGEAQENLKVVASLFAVEELSEGDGEEEIAGDDQEVADDDGEEVGDVPAQGDRDGTEERGEVIEGEPVDSLDAFVEAGVCNRDDGVEGQEDDVLDV